MSAPSNTWNSSLYQSSHSFVWEYGRDVVGLLDPKPGERILDLGCGTGQHASEIAQSGAEVIGVDASLEMISSARANFPQLRLEVADATALPFRKEFDAVFSNAALHWIRDQHSAIASISGALKPGGRFVFEMGGHLNLHHVVEAANRAMAEFGVESPQSHTPWHFPSIGEYAPLLEQHGFEVRFSALFDRPTELKDGERGFAAWIKMFGAFALSAVSEEQKPELIRRWEDLARPKLFRDGRWILDYRRLRMVAVKL
jgi:trans-aconitate 2-methyltransferase